MHQTNLQAKLQARGEGNKGSREKLEREELRSRLFGLFAKKDVYMLKELNKELQQSEVRIDLVVVPCTPLPSHPPCVLFVFVFR